MSYFLITIIAILVVILFQKFMQQFNSRGKYENIDAGTFIGLSKEPNTVILDVRQPGEIAEGKIKGAKAINVLAGNFMEEVDKLPKDKTYLVYCRSGNRSGMACGKMAGLGFAKLYNLQGGYGAWLRAK
ncbi:MAG: rhodanese-like domain-containing protein [Lewinella sp.]|jgi:rhodanese-related sulfurtransferase|uniref:rhodanese-like domain-containing protein n=1 Tax=Lewinella sp. TaxID=2004506 RepID=UPI003D6A041B